MVYRVYHLRDYHAPQDEGVGKSATALTSTAEPKAVGMLSVCEDSNLQKESI